MTKNLEIMRLMTYYLNPCTLILVGMGIAFANDLPEDIINISIILAVSLTLFNFITLAYATKRPEHFSTVQITRISFNYVANVLLVFILYAFWQPIWLIFLLTLIGISAISDRTSTIANAVFMSVMLLWIMYKRDMLKEEMLGMGLTYIVIFFLASLFINHVVMTSCKHLEGYKQYPLPPNTTPEK